MEKKQVRSLQVDKLIFISDGLKEKFNSLSFYEKELLIDILEQSIRESLVKINTKLQ